MLRITALLILLLCACPVYADQLDGLRVLGIIIPAFIIAFICFVVMFISAIYRFSQTKKEPNLLLNLSSIVLIITILMTLIGLGGGVKNDFILFCFIVIIIAVVFLFYNNMNSTKIPRDLIITRTTEEDLHLLFHFQTDRDAIYMAAFTPENPHDREAYLIKWSKLIQNPNIVMFTLRLEGHIVGNVVHFQMLGETNVSYWIDRKYWGLGIATEGLKKFLAETNVRPLYARTAFDNYGSQRVLEKCGFVRIREEKAFANARQKEIEEFVFRLS